MPASLGHRLARVLGVTLLYIIVAKLGLAFGAGGAEPSPIHPASGLAIALLYLGGMGLWPGVLLGGTLASAAAGLSLPLAITLGAGNTVEALVGAWLLGRVLDPDRPFQRIREVLGFVALVSGVAPLVGASLGTAMIQISDATAGGRIEGLWLWWLGDAAGTLIIAPLVVVWARSRPRRLEGQRLVQTILLVVTTVGLTTLVFRGWIGGESVLYLFFPLIVWAALFGREHAAVAASAGIALIAAWETARDSGPMADASGALFIALSLGAFIATLTLTGLVLAAFVAQRVNAEREAVRLLEGERVTRADAERTARRTNEILETISDAFMTLDGAWRITFANHEALRLSHLVSKSHLVGNTIWEAMPNLIGTVFERRYREAMATQQITHFEEHFAPFGAWFTVDLYPSPHQLMVYFRDVTERRKLEEQVRQSHKMEAIGQLAGGVAHDFNNLLQVVRGYGELALRRLETGKDGADVAVKEMLDAADRAADLTSQLLAFGRRQVLNPEVLDLNDVVGEMDRLLRRLIGEQVELVTVLSPTPVFVKVDRSRMEQVIVNLAVNGRDAMPDGGHLAIKVGRGEIDPQSGVTAVATLVVSDTGTGMDGETLPHIFEPFFTTKGERGTGLGLSTVHGIITQSGGDIAVQSESGRGTTFEIRLPICQGAPAIGAAVSARSTGGAETVLVVEDDPSVREIVRATLASRGYRLLLAESGDAALANIQDEIIPIALLLTDVIMPGLSGRETAERFRALHPDAKVLFMSGYADDPGVRRGSLGPHTASIQKPFSGDELARRIRELLDGGEHGGKQ